MDIKNIINSYNNTNLVIRIFIGIIIGACLAVILPNSSWIEIFGSLFVGSLKAIAPILVFVLVISSLAQGNKKSDGRFRTVVVLYLIATFLAAISAVIFSYIFPQDLLLDVNTNGYQVPQSIDEVTQNMLVKIVINPLSSLTEGNYLGILFWSIISGLALKNIAAESTKSLLQDFANGVSQVVSWIINFAPFGIMGLVYSAVSTNGIDIFTTYGKLLVLLVGCMLFVALITNPLIVYFVLKKNPYPLILKCLKESGITAFFTRSSAANIPVNLTLCKNLGLDKEVYSVSIPLGATINMSGAAVTITIMALAAVQTLGIEVHLVTAFLLSILATFGACGASGVAGGSLLLIPMACSLFGISNDIAIHVVGVGFVVGVIQDSMETALNSSSDVVFSATSEYKQLLAQGKEIPKI